MSADKYAFLDRRTAIELDACRISENDEKERHYEQLFVTAEAYEFLQEKYNLLKWRMEGLEK